MRFLTATLCAALLLAGCSEKEDTETISPEGPEVVSTVPENGSGKIDGTTLEITLNFDQKIRCLNSGRITVDNGASVEKVSCPGEGIVINLSGLAAGKSYTVIVPVGCIQGLKEGQKAFAGYKFNFSMRSASQGALEPATDEAGWPNAALAVKNMKYGWNLGNSLDSNGAWLKKGTTVEQYETAWGQPVTKPELLKMFADEGFGVIRVPVTWYQHIDDEGNIDSTWMNRVVQVVGYVHAAGMYCILNVHHDTGEDSDDVKHWLHADIDVYNSVKDKYIKIWQQIATRFKDYDEWLLFESFNEMLDNDNTWNDPKNSTSYDAINKYNADFVATVRATGGNNAHRNLILNTYGASNSEGSLSAFVLPQDTVDDHLIAEVHSYSPYLFAFDVEQWAKTTWDSSCDSEIKTQAERLNKYFVQRGIPCIIGEYGCTSKRAESEIAKQAKSYVTNAGKYGIACLYWMGLSDGTDRSVPKWTMPTVKDAIKEAYNSLGN